MNTRLRCQQVAARQHWVIHRTQVLEAGGSAGFIHRQIRDSGWKKVFPKVYLVGGAPYTFKTRLMAATLWAGPGAVASHTSAAWLYGLLSSKPRTIEVTMRERRRPPAGIKVHLDASLPDAPAVRFDGIPVPRVERMLFDICGCYPLERAAAMVVRAIRNDQVELVLLARVLDSAGGPGKPGTKTLRTILTKRLAMGVTDSEAEDLFAAMAEQRGFRFQHHHVVRSGGFEAELDFCSREDLLDIEIDGGDHHNPINSDLDKQRDVELGKRGWLVLRFSYWDLVGRPDWVFDSIRQALAVRRAQGFTFHAS